MTTTYAWAPITKVEEQDDGTVMVYGPAADAGVDRDKQRLNQDWLDQAMPKWMAEGGNVREQHDSKRAVGVGVGLTRDADGAHQLAAAVIDPVAIAKVKPLYNADGTIKRPAVLKGFSVGIKDPHVTFGKADAPNGEVDGGSIIEVSLVDRPSNPRTLFTMVKADASGDLEEVEDPEVEETEDEPETAAEAGAEDETDEADEETTFKMQVITKSGHELHDLVLKFVSAAQRRKDATSGVAMDNGDFPIPDAGHLQSAIGLLKDYTGDKAAAKAHIISRARALGLTSKLPEDWNVSKADAVTEPVGEPADATKTDTPDLTKVEGQVADMVKAAVAEAVKPLEDKLTKAEAEVELVKAELAKALELPVAGGPVATRTASQTAVAREKDASFMRSQADEYLRKADETQDLTLRQGYREIADELRVKADLGR